MMNRIFLCLCFSLFLLSASPVLSGQATVTDTVLAFLEALKAGNTDSIRAHTGGLFAAQFHQLSQQDNDYTFFLRQHYKDAHFEIVTIDQKAATAHVNIRFHFPDGTSRAYILRLRSDPENNWRVVEQREY